MRELENAVERAVILAERGNEIDAELLGLQQLKGKKATGSRTQVINESEEIESMEEVERKHIQNALKTFAGNRTHAAEKLGLNVRTLRNKIKQYKLD